MRLKDYCLFNTITYLDQVDSTNNYIKRQLQSGDGSIKAGSVVAARWQTLGRGRKDRKWISGKDTSLTFSFLLDLKHKDTNDIAAITLAAGVGTAMALNTLGLDCRLKWPNDIFIQDKKLCGILSETIYNNQNLQAVCGIGINVNMDNRALSSIDAAATSIYVETAVKNPPFELLPTILTGLDQWLGVWYEQGTKPIIDKWMSLAYGLGKPVQSVNSSGSIEPGFFVGVGTQGQLKLRTVDGGVKEVWAGDIVWQ